LGCDGVEERAFLEKRAKIHATVSNTQFMLSTKQTFEVEHVFSHSDKPIKRGQQERV